MRALTKREHLARWNQRLIDLRGQYALDILWDRMVKVYKGIDDPSQYASIHTEIDAMHLHVVAYDVPPAVVHELECRVREHLAVQQARRAG